MRFAKLATSNGCNLTILWSPFRSNSNSRNCTPNSCTNVARSTCTFVVATFSIKLYVWSNVSVVCCCFCNWRDKRKKTWSLVKHFNRDSSDFSLKSNSAPNDNSAAFSSSFIVDVLVQGTNPVQQRTQRNKHYSRTWMIGGRTKQQPWREKKSCFEQ